MAEFTLFVCFSYQQLQINNQSHERVKELNWNTHAGGIAWRAVKHQKNNEEGHSKSLIVR